MSIQQTLRAFIPRPARRWAKTCGRIVWRAAVPALEDLPDAPDLFRVYRSLLNQKGLQRKPGGWFYNGSFYPDYITVGGASHAIARTAQRYCKGKGVDIGAGLWPIPGATPVDIWRGPGAGRTLDELPDASLDYVFSSHCLEHIDHWNDALNRWISKLVPGGTIFLYLPHPDCALWQRGSPFVGDGHLWSPSPAAVIGALQSLGCDIVAVDEGPDPMWSFHVCGRRR
jgi:SAM-dependent methyltransferase